jgi:hypothetical protein
MSRPHFREGRSSLNGHIAAHRQIVFSNPATAFAMVEWRDGGLVLREVLERRRSG